MKVADISFSYDEGITTEEHLLQQHYTITGWVEALQKQGVEIVVLKRFSKESSFKRNTVQHHFIKDFFGGRLRPWHIPIKFLNKIKNLHVDVVHIHGFMFPVQVLLLKLLLSPKTILILQHHGGNPPKGIKGYLYGMMNSAADGFFFTTMQQGKEWFEKKQLSKIMPVMEGSNNFVSCKKSAAGEIIQLKGNPIFLWVGRLDNNKDPLTVLTGFEMLAKKYPTISLYMVYGDDNLLKAVKHKIDSSMTLSKSVHLLGNIPHNELQAYYNSADYFILGSHHEGSGYALSEALACGCIPIVTNIPSFTMMTDNARLGALWQTGNSQSFMEASITAMKKDIQIESKACTDFFETHLSFDAIASTAIMHYQKAIHRHS